MAVNVICPVASVQKFVRDNLVSIAIEDHSCKLLKRFWLEITGGAHGVFWSERRSFDGALSSQYNISDQLLAIHADGILREEELCSGCSLIVG